MIRRERRKMISLLPVALALLVSGCGGHEETPIIRVSPSVPVAVESIVPVRTNGEPGTRELLLVPATSVFRNGELAGVLVVGADHRSLSDGSGRAWFYRGILWCLEGWTRESLWWESITLRLVKD